MTLHLRVLVLVFLCLTSCQSAPTPVPPSCPCACPAPSSANPAPMAEMAAPAAESASQPAPSSPPAPDYDAWLEYFDAQTGKRQIFPIQSGKVVRVGRASPDQAKPDIDLGQVVDGNTVSRRHAEIVQREGTWMLFIQPDTTNRSFLNTQIVDRGSLNPLNSGDEIQLGDVTLVFRTRDGEGSSKHP